MNEELEFAKGVARKAGDIMRQYFNGDQHVEIKSDGSPVTVADKLVNSMVIEEIEKAFPLDGVIGEEESNTEYGMGRKWFCDPIDGTKAFTWGTPTAMFSLGLVVDGVPQMGVIYNPFIDDLYYTARGMGAFKNDQPIHVNSIPFAQGTTVVTSDIAKASSEGIPYLNKLKETGTNMATFSGAVCKMALTSEGRFSAYIETIVNAHDLAAAHAIIEEAGGTVTGLTGAPLDYSRPFKGTIVSNGINHDKLVEFVAEG